MSMVDVTPTEKKIAERVDPGVTGELAIADRAGGLAFVSMDQVMEFAKLMAISSIAIPKHLRGNPGACLGICIQAIEWQMSPYSVANKSYSVNDRLSYEAQLIEAVSLRRAPIKGRPKIEFDGDAGNRTCRIWAELRDEPGEIVEYISPPFDRINPKNSPLWKNDPDQQHFYYSVRAWCRRHFPDVLLGVYARDEIDDDGEPLAAAVGVVRERPTLAKALDALAAPQGGDSGTQAGPAAEAGDGNGDGRAAAPESADKASASSTGDGGDANASVSQTAAKDAKADPKPADNKPEVQAQSENPVPPEAAKDAKAAKADKPKPPKIPTTEREYEVFAKAWIDAVIAEGKAPSVLKDRWSSPEEKKIRNGANVSTEMREALFEYLVAAEQKA
jgi:hypothetical protein